MFEDVKVIVGGCLQLSLVPTPFLLPLFDWLQHTKTEGEGLGDLYVHSNVIGRHTEEWRTMRISKCFLSRDLKNRMIERQCQYNSLFGRF